MARVSALSVSLEQAPEAAPSTFVPDAARIASAFEVRGGVEVPAGARLVALETTANMAVGDVPWGLASAGLPPVGRWGLSLRGDANLEALLAALGLTGTLEPLPDPALGILREGRLVACDAGSPARLLATAPLGSGARARALGIGLELWRLRAFLDPARPERAAPFDARPASARLRLRAGEEAWTWLVAKL